MSLDLLRGVGISADSKVMAFQDLTDFLDFIGNRRIQGLSSPIANKWIRAVRIGEEEAVLISPVAGPIVVITNVLW